MAFSHLLLLSLRAPVSNTILQHPACPVPDHLLAEKKVPYGIAIGVHAVAYPASLLMQAALRHLPLTPPAIASI